MFYSEVEELNSNHDQVILLGDFNARTASLTDINEIDNALCDFADIDASSVFDTDIFQYLNVNGMSYERFSQDKQTNRTGRTLIDFCKVHDLLLLYGRAYQDKLVGKLTCKNAPTVDYVISSANALHLFADFNIDDLCPLHSDVHSPITFNL